MNKKNTKTDIKEEKKIDTKKTSTFKKKRKLKKILHLVLPTFILLSIIQ